jgi:ubiquinone/menaquinone biosynthesis C-methylase UbiE
MSTKMPVNLKYHLYEESVQCHESDIDFLNQEFKKEFGKPPLVLREDFGGSGAMAVDWVRQSTKHYAYAIDLDSEPMEYGKQFHLSKIAPEHQQRMEYIQGNVLDSYNFKSDVIVAFNFSYFIFKKRKDLLEYFKKVRRELNEQGAFFIDLFGGENSQEVLVEETEHDNHTYYWDCESFDPINNHCHYKIHFKTHEDGKKYENVFSYDWRLWSLPELKDILEDAGFSKVVTYWEEDDEEEEGEGNGVFYRTESEENCESWITYIMAIP